MEISNLEIPEEIKALPKHDKTGEMDQETIKRLFYVSAPVAEYGFSSYCGWIKRNAGRFGFEDVDTRIYNHFFPPYL